MSGVPAEAGSGVVAAVQAEKEGKNWMKYFWLSAFVLNLGGFFYHVAMWKPDGIGINGAGCLLLLLAAGTGFESHDEFTEAQLKSLAILSEECNNAAKAALKVQP